MAKLHEYEVFVEGAATFPLDMLRYDCLFPASEFVQERDGWGSCGGSAEIAASVRFEDGAFGIIRYRLIGWHEHGWRPTDGRWESFGYQVVASGKTGRS